jgi:hypothetical protein
MNSRCLAIRECICTLLAKFLNFENFENLSIVPELFVFHVSHVIIVSILECFHGASAISLLVFSYADDTIDNRENDADSGRYNL